MSTCHLMNFINMHIPCIESNAWILNLKIYRLLFRCEIPLCTPLHYILVIWSNFSEWKMMSKFSTRRIWKSMNINWQWHIQISQSYNNYIVISRAILFLRRRRSETLLGRVTSQSFVPSIAWCGAPCTAKWVRNSRVLGAHHIRNKRSSGYSQKNIFRIFSILGGVLHPSIQVHG